MPPDLASLPAALASLTGEVAQVPPVYSALKRDGRPLHRRARGGEAVAAPPARRVRIDRLEVLGAAWGEPAAPDEPRPDLLAPGGRVHAVRLRVACSAGTYVRSLARDLAAALGTAGHLHALRRTAVGPFTLDAAVALAAWAAAPAPAAAVAPLAAALPHVPAVTVTAAQAARLRRGGQLDAAALPPGLAEGSPLRLLDGRGDLVAVVRGPDRLAAVFPGAADGEDASCA